MIIRKEFLSYSPPSFDDKEVAAITQAIRSGWWSRGPKVAEFEKEFSRYIGVKHALAVNSCTAALHLALVAYGIGPGDEVITTDMTFVSSANVVIHCGARPVLVDIDENTGLIDPLRIEEKISARTKAIIPVHYGGQPCHMDVINYIAGKHGLFVLEDAAHAVDTRYQGKIIGSGDNAVAFSFYATKNLATGEGGMLTSPDAKFMEKARTLSLHGMNKDAWNRYAKGGSWRYDILVPGYKDNMSDIAASLGLVQLAKLPQMQKTRRRYAEIYDKAFAEIPGVQVLPPVENGVSAHHLYIIKIDPNLLTITRDEFIEQLAETYNVGTSVHFIPLHTFSYYKQTFGYKKGSFPAAERFFSRVLSLPLYPAMQEEDVHYVAQAVRELATKYSK